MDVPRLQKGFSSKTSRLPPLPSLKIACKDSAILHNAASFIAVFRPSGYVSDHCTSPFRCLPPVPVDLGGYQTSLSLQSPSSVPHSPPVLHPCWPGPSARLAGRVCQAWQARARSTCPSARLAGTPHAIVHPAAASATGSRNWPGPVYLFSGPIRPGLVRFDSCKLLNLFYNLSGMKFDTTLFFSIPIGEAYFIIWRPKGGVWAHLSLGTHSKVGKKSILIINYKKS